uniref:DDE Tnp4 domain-containing protein n=1 Tax=Eutreptiella gymnastica TaxID=73025 RepID=A0A7S1N4Y7_9EUGL|mmetsp:Transcript_120138/g.209141  ORF Transcript_120138/g.209141 Transcript_120138/m.209141 type:complete len:256 (+) Transcript_120138:182-949(+)
MFLAVLPQSIATMSVSYVYGKEYSQWNIPVTGARGMCGTFTSVILGSMIVGPITDVFLDTITSHAAHLHCLSLPRRNQAWANIWDAHQYLDLKSQIDLHCQPYEHANQLGSVLESLHSDSTLFREYHMPALDKFFREKGIGKPPQGKLILGLGDGAYQACPYVIYPYRKDHKWGDLEVDYTAIHAWYRARVEHTFGILWNFALVKNIWMGKGAFQAQRFQWRMHVLLNLVAMDMKCKWKYEPYGPWGHHDHHEAN